MSEVFASSRRPTADDSYTSSPCSSFGEGKGSSHGLGGFRELPANLAAAACVTVCDIRCSGFERHRLCVSCMCLLMMANGSNDEPAMDSERRVQKGREGNEQACTQEQEDGSDWASESEMDSERRVRKFVMRLVDGEGKELERREEEPICSQSASKDFLVQNAFWQLDGIRRQLLGDATTLEEAAEVLKYRVTGPEWQDVTDEELLQRYEQQQQQWLERDRMQQEQERSRQEAYKKRNSWWRTLLRSHVVFWDHATCVVHAVGLPGTRYCLRVRHLLLLGAIKAGARLVRHKRAQATKPPRTHWTAVDAVHGKRLASKSVVEAESQQGTGAE